MKLFDLKPCVIVGTSRIKMLAVGQYSNGRISVSVYDELIDPYAVVSVNLPDQNLPGDGKETFFARNYGYHEATFKALLDDGIIEVVPGIGHVGMHGICCIAKLTAKATANPREVKPLSSTPSKSSHAITL